MHFVITFVTRQIYEAFGSNLAILPSLFVIYFSLCAVIIERCLISTGQDSPDSRFNGAKRANLLLK